MNDADANSMQEVAEQPTKTLTRRGDVDKCPACGAGIHPDAYHCSVCQNDFCYHCRARLLPSDIQLQCINQHCDYYGKLVCSVCDVLTEKQENPSVYQEPEDGYWPGLLAVSFVLFCALWYFYSFLSGLIWAVLFFAGLGWWLHTVGINIFGRQREVEQTRRTSKYDCICCGEPVKKLVVPHD